MTKGSQGTWLARAYDGEKYHFEPVGEFAALPEKERFDAAKRAAQEWFEHLDHGGATDSETVRGACEAYVEELKTQNSASASLDAAGRFRRLIYSDPVAKIHLTKLTATQVSTWKKRVLARGGTKGSFNRNATTFRASLNLAFRRRLVSSDHAWRDELAPFEGADGRRDLYLPRQSRKKLIDKASGEVKSFVRGLALLPLRPGDVAALKVSALDSKHGILDVPAGKTRTRKIPLSGDALTHFKSAAKDKVPGAWLFARANGDQWKKEAWREGIHKAAESANLPKAVCAYTLRHSAITDLVSSGLDLFHVAQLAGTSVAMIEKHYGHLQRQQIRKGLNVLSLT